MFYEIKKGLLYLLILLSFLSFVNADSITKELEIGESIYLSGINVTLVAFDPEEDKVIVCVNGEKNIIPKEGRTIKGVLIEPRYVSDYYAEVRLKTSIEGSCGIECSNDVCFTGKLPIEEQLTNEKIVTTTTVLIEENIEVEEAPLTGEVVREDSEISVLPLIGLILVLIIGFFIVFKRK